MLIVELTLKIFTFMNLSERILRPYGIFLRILKESLLSPVGRNITHHICKRRFNGRFVLGLVIRNIMLVLRKRKPYFNIPCFFRDQTNAVNVAKK